LKEGAALYQTIFPSPAAGSRHIKPLAAGEGSGLGLLLIIVVNYEKKPIVMTLSNHQDISKLPALGHFYLTLRANKKTLPIWRQGFRVYYS